MARKKEASTGGVNKTQAIKDALAKDPGASPSQLAAELTAAGIEVSPGYVSTIKTTMKSQGPASAAVESRAQEAPAAVATAPARDGVSKSQAIRDVLARDPKAMPKDVAAELNAQGIDVTPTYVSMVKSGTKSKGKAKRKKRRAAAASPAVTTAAASRGSGNGAALVDVAALVKAKTLVEQVGGFEKAQELLAALKKLQ